jgi:hypothetical protein
MTQKEGVLAVDKMQLSTSQLLKVALAICCRSSASASGHKSPGA